MSLRVQTVAAQAEQRRAIYDDVEELLIPGFLSQTVEAGGIQLSMKSLFPGEMYVLRNRLGRRITERLWREWAVATSTWMLDGQVLLGDVNAAVRVREAIRSLPGPALDSLFSVFMSLRNRMHIAASRVEAYCYEDFGRATWRMTGRKSPSRDDVAGVPGVSSLGMNHVQRLWVAYNLAEDDRQAWNLEWAAAKLIASASSPKGVKQLNQKDESDRNLENDRRQGVIRKAYYQASGRQIDEEDGMVVRRAVSADELANEMERWARGEHDPHDQIIEAYKNKIREQHEANRRAHEARMQAVAMLQEEAAEAGVAPLVGYTLDQLRELRGGPEAPLQRRGSAIMDSSSASRLYDKYLANEIRVGGLAEGGKSAPLPTERSGGLADAVASRQVRYRDDGEAS